MFKLYCFSSSCAVDIEPISRFLVPLAHRRFANIDEEEEDLLKCLQQYS